MWGQRLQLWTHLWILPRLRLWLRFVEPPKERQEPLVDSVVEQLVDEQLVEPLVEQLVAEELVEPLVEQLAVEHLVEPLVEHLVEPLVEEPSLVSPKFQQEEP